MTNITRLSSFPFGGVSFQIIIDDTKIGDGNGASDDPDFVYEGKAYKGGIDLILADDGYRGSWRGSPPTGALEAAEAAGERGGARAAGATAAVARPRHLSSKEPAHPAPGLSSGCSVSAFGPVLLRGLPLPLE